MSSQKPEISYRPVTSKNLPDLVHFSGCHGKFAYCSCMRWRMKSTVYQKSSKEARASKLEQLVKESVPVGVLAYYGADPVGWCSVAPRETYEALERYKALPRIDDAQVWSVVCFFVDRRFRHQQLTLGLLAAALDYARSQGVKIVEAYPVEPEARLYTYMGSPKTFEKTGFQEVTPTGQPRRIMRFSFA